MDLEYLLNECEKPYDGRVSQADNIIKEVEDEFKGYKSIKTVRKDEKNDLLLSLEKYQNEMKKLCRKCNIKTRDSQKRSRIMKNISDRKKKNQNKINELKLKLQDLEIESGDYDTPMTESVNNTVRSSLTPYDDMLF